MEGVDRSGIQAYSDHIFVVLFHHLVITPSQENSPTPNFSSTLFLQIKNQDLIGTFSATFSTEYISFYMKISPGDMIANIPLSYGKIYSDPVQSIFQLSTKGYTLITLHHTELRQPKWSAYSSEPPAFRVPNMQRLLLYNLDARLILPPPHLDPPSM